jgi:hypothetical protein
LHASLRIRAALQICKSYVLIDYASCDTLPRSETIVSGGIREDAQTGYLLICMVSLFAATDARGEIMEFTIVANGVTIPLPPPAELITPGGYAYSPTQISDLNTELATARFRLPIPGSLRGQ